MVQIIPESQGFGQQFAKQIGSGISQGVGQKLDLYNQLQLEKEREKLRRGTLLEQGKSSIPSSFSNSKSKTTTDIDSKNSVSSEIKPTIPGYSQKVLNPQELQMKAINRTQEKISKGLPTTYEDELSSARQENSDIASYKQLQSAYGQEAEDALLRVMPRATDEQKSILRRKGELLADQNLTEADLKKQAALEAKKFTNQIASVAKSLPPKRAFTRIKEGILGSGRTPEKVRESIRIKLKPLLDEGLYDTARDLLSKVGYQPEERESILSSLGESTKKELATFPVNGKSFTEKAGFRIGPKELDENQQLILKDSLKKIFTEDPSANLVLLRKAFEDKRVPWNSFKDKLDELVSNGHIKMNEDQMKMFDILDEPPLDRLDKILFNLKLTGR